MLLSDGAPEMCNQLDEAFDAETFVGVETHRLIDFWHVIEKLSAAAHVIAGKDQAPPLVARWKLLLLNRSKASEQILDELVASGKEHVRVGDEQPRQRRGDLQEPRWCAHEAPRLTMEDRHRRTHPASARPRSQ